MNAQGRVVVPVQVRERLNVPKGSEFVLYVDGERIVMEQKGEARSRLFALGAQLAPEDVNLTEEFLQDRREAARREGGE
ncbi:AbrB/MazE/SpoVT family DNA-binding domain-containing protein [Deinococcus sp. QL22]|uniref:AbrB/MazE/SpoVT family DNA-binding domain-containing protein n=1 Tax=Deinococcus sp. QL22 TaxID=2939437 RepID=UPI002017F74C|nr:AbrB/MazE/SpoVT family DNA-binding domain-containing protein [Deinococcus sp. QL22]UQN09485.1 AbrB/MazE/SpoVT family DNA-binding domain-containing protein [Deinococcus sp. QL22]